MSRLLSLATPSAPLWSSLDAAVRQTLRSLSAPATDISVFEAVEGEQARIRRQSRHWLVG